MNLYHPVSFQPTKVDNILEIALADKPDIDLSWIDAGSQENGWSLDTKVLSFLGRLVLHLEPRHILEFGSGLSTQFLLKRCVEFKLDCAISSVDHDEDYSWKPIGDIYHAKFNLQIAPIVARICAGELLTTYRVDRMLFASGAPADLIIIDGPPTILGGREGVLYQAIQFSQPGTVILLDDADRPGETAALANCKKVLKDAIEIIHLPGFPKGLAAIIIKKPLYQYSTEILGFYKLIEDIRSCIPAGERLILIGQEVTGIDNIPGYKLIPFIENEGIYWGLPPDSKTAIAELKRLAITGIGYLVIASPAFWWLEYYKDFQIYLRTNCYCCCENENVIIFDLTNLR